MAAQRLRKTFKYPNEEDDEDAVEEGMDEQDQQAILSSLTAHDHSATHTYTLLLLVLPLAPIALFLPRLFRTSTVLPSLAAITGLLGSAYTLYYLPLAPYDDDEEADAKSPKNKNKKKVKPPANVDANGNIPSWDRPHPTLAPRPVPFLSPPVTALLADHLTTANRALAGLLALNEARHGTGWMDGLFVEAGYLPLLICLVVLWARTELRIIDMSALERLKVREGEGLGPGTGTGAGTGAGGGRKGR